MPTILCAFGNESSLDLAKLSEGERLTFDIDVLFLDRVAVGNSEMTLIDPKAMIFKARVEAKIVRFFMHRRNVYESVMRYSPEEKKFRPISFSECKYKREKSYMKKFYYDKNKGVLVEELWKDGVLEKSKEKPLAEKDFHEDIVSAFYNVRLQAYGKVEEGKKFVVQSMHRDGKFYFTISVLEGKAKEKIASKDEDSRYKGKYYVEVMTPKEVFDAQGGRLFIGFTDELLPYFVLVKKVLGIGTIRGKLVSVERVIPSSSNQDKESTISKKLGKE
ncbi:DUF3108 domain-containing protein [bacterium]|nr:DUF3108 domain-containing protein [bacterium]